MWIWICWCLSSSFRIILKTLYPLFPFMGEERFLMLLGEIQRNVCWVSDLNVLWYTLLQVVCLCCLLPHNIQGYSDFNSRRRVVLLQIFQRIGNAGQMAPNNTDLPHVRPWPTEMEDGGWSNARWNHDPELPSRPIGLRNHRSPLLPACVDGRVSSPPPSSLRYISPFAILAHFC